MDEGKRIFKEMVDEEYEKLADRRRNDDFIVDDDGLGYRDHGGEIWEDDDEGEGDHANKKNKKRKLDVSTAIFD